MTNKDNNNYYNKMEKDICKLVNSYFKGAREHEKNDKAFLEMSKEHRLLDILVYVKSLSRTH